MNDFSRRRLGSRKGSLGDWDFTARGNDEVSAHSHQTPAQSLKERWVQLLLSGPQPGMPLRLQDSSCSKDGG